MSLGTIVARVENELQYQPDLAAYRRDVRQLVNTRYLLLSKERNWPWLNKRAPLWVFPDLVIQNSQVTLPGGGVYGSRTFLMNDTVFEPYYDGYADWITRFRRLLCGAEFGVTDTDLVLGGASNWEDGPFTIELAESHPSSPPARTLLHLDPRCAISSITGSEGTYTLKFPRYLLPADMDVLRSVVDEQGRELAMLEPGQERRLGLLPTATGQRPSWALEDFGHATTHPQFIYPGLSDVTPSNPDQTEDLYQRANPPVRVAPILNFTGTSGLWKTSTTVRVAFAWFYANRLGPLGPYTEATSDTDTRSLAVSNYNAVGLLPVQATATAGAYGRRLAIFVSEDLTAVTNGGQGPSAYYFRGFVNPGDGTTSFTIASPRDSGTATTGTIRANGTLDLPRHDRMYPGTYQYLRLYPRPEVPAKYELDYRSRAMEMVEDSDAPEFPSVFEEVLVYATCLEMAKRYARSADVSVWEKSHAEWNAKLVQHYLPQLRYELQKGAVGQVPSNPLLRADAIRYTP